MREDFQSPGSACELRAPAATPLDTLGSLVGSRVDVEVLVRSAGELERQELPMQPGEYTETRLLTLQQGDHACAWRLWDNAAVRYGKELVGRRVRVQGAGVHRVRGENQLT